MKILNRVILSLFCCIFVSSILLTALSSPTASPQDTVVLLATEFGGGTGFEVIAPSGKIYTLTNRHVCENTSTVRIDDHSIQLQIIEISRTSDLCLLTRVLDLPGLTVASRDFSSNDKLDIYGYGNLMGLTHTEGRYVGMVGELFFVKNSGYCTATVLRGNSGSPVLNSNGEVAGVVFASGSDIANRAIIVPLSDIKNFLRIY